MPLKLRILLLLALSACTSKRPEGAYVSTYDAGESCRSDFEDCGDAGNATPTNDTGAVGPDLDAGPTETPDANGQEPDVDPSDPLAGLAGRYLMRIDYYSTLSASSAGNTLTLKNRVSNLFYSELRPVNGALQATETFCFQNSAHKCVAGCSNWTTTYALQLPNKYKMLAPTVRTYTVTGNTLSAAMSLLSLGYDGAQTPLPSGTSDSRVWKLGSSTNNLRGVPTVLKGYLLPAIGGMTTLDCEVDSVMVFGTSFSVNLASLDAASLSGAGPIDIVPDGTEAAPIYAGGEPAVVFCDLATLKGGGTASNDLGFVRFMKTELSGCPASADEFENTFKITQSEIDNVDPPK